MQLKALCFWPNLIPYTPNTAHESLSKPLHLEDFANLSEQEARELLDLLDGETRVLFYLARARRGGVANVQQWSS